LTNPENGRLCYTRTYLSFCTRLTNYNKKTIAVQLILLINAWKLRSSAPQGKTDCQPFIFSYLKIKMISETFSLTGATGGIKKDQSAGVTISANV